MFSFKVCIIHCILMFLILVDGELTIQHPEEENSSNANKKTANSAAEDSPSIHDSSKPKPGPRPTTFATSNPLPPNIFHTFLTQLLKPTKISGKTFGSPSVIAIIGDKPYISLEVFNKFSPFRWLLNAFQAKVNNICGFIAQPGQSDSPVQIPDNIFGQEGENQQPLSGFGQTLMSTGPIKVYDIPLNVKNMKQQRT